MITSSKDNISALEQEVTELKQRLFEAEDTLEAIRTGAVDALLIDGNEGLKVYTLQTADHTYRVLIEEMNEGALILSSDATVLYSNQSFADLLQMPLEQVIGQSFYQFIYKDHISAVEKMVQGASSKAKHLETKIIGSKKNASVRLSVKIIKDSESTVWSVTVSDISEQVRASKKIKAYQRQLEKNLDELKRSNGDLEQFAYIASHDLMEPLRMISNFTQLLLRHVKANDNDSLEYQGFILDGINRMERMVKDLLKYSRVGRVDVAFESVNLNNLIEVVKENLQTQIKESGAEVIYDNLPVIRAVPGLITQVFQNLIANAIKFAKPKEKPRIEIEAHKRDGHWEFCVKDDGIGIDEKFADRIFVIFQRLHTQDKYQGSGIGLAITKKIIDFHGGQIWLKSKLGHGCVFHFTLPEKGAK